MSGKIRVLLADGSSSVRSLLRVFFQSGDDFEVVGIAKTGQDTLAMNRTLRPNLVVIDLTAPMAGELEAIEEIMTTQAVAILAVTDGTGAERAQEAVARGALFVAQKPAPEPAQIARFLASARLVAGIPVAVRTPAPKTMPTPHAAKSATETQEPATLASSPNCRVFAVASSTGGPQALARVLSKLKPGFSCPILIAQHMAEGFTAGLADWLSTLSALPVKLAQEGAPIRLNTVYLAQSESHLAVSPSHAFKLVAAQSTDIYHPSCNVLLTSAAAVYGRRTVGIIMTGMGDDGATGMKEIAAAGGQTLAQDEPSSVVFGMNRVAIEKGYVSRVLPLDEIPDAMNRLSAESLPPVARH